MRRRVAQPPVDRARRARETRGCGAGLAAALVGLGLLIFGLRHSTGVETVEGGVARETQLIKACASGGLRYPEQAALAPPASDDPEALERWVKEGSRAKLPDWKLRVDTTAATRCPT